MEPTLSYPELKIDQQAGAYLMSAAKWNMFLSIIGFICCGFILLCGLFFIVAGRLISAFYHSGLTPGFGFIIGGIYLLSGVIYFIPCLYLYVFSSKMQKALRHGTQSLVNEALANFKAYSKYIGIVVIVGISLCLLAGILAPIIAIIANL